MQKNYLTVNLSSVDACGIKDTKAMDRVWIMHGIPTKKNTDFYSNRLKLYIFIAAPFQMHFRYLFLNEETQNRVMLHNTKLR